jgi:prophage antirepressor-like protein
MNELTFAFDQSSVRFVDGFPVARDVADALGYSDADAALKKVFKCNISTIPGTVNHRTIRVLNEGGVYQLIFGSKLESAERFQHWVFEEVLPAIQRDGGFVGKNLTGEQLARIQSQLDWQQGRLLRASRETEDADRRANRYLQLLLDNGIDPDTPVDEPEFSYQDEDIDYDEDTNDDGPAPF